jgi:hypothetical protein
MLRGVWGAALCDLDEDVYHAVFAPNEHGSQAGGDGRRARPDAGGGQTSAAGYVLRPAPPDPQFAPAVEWILIGQAIEHDVALCRAWDIASGMGLGPQRRRFHLRKALALQSDGNPVEGGNAWRLSDARFPSAPDQDSPGHSPQGPAPKEPVSGRVNGSPCRLTFPAPVRLIRHGRLIEAPTLADIIVSACRRVRAYLPPALHAEWDSLSREALEHSRSIPAASWRGRRLDLHRYSATQRAEVDLRGVTGSIDLPQGPGEVWPLLAASQWLHLGKGTVMGLGELRAGALRDA